MTCLRFWYDCAVLENKNKNKNINKPSQRSGLLGLYEVHSQNYPKKKKKVHSQSQSNPSFSLSEAQMKSIAVM